MVTTTTEIALAMLRWVPCCYARSGPNPDTTRMLWTALARYSMEKARSIPIRVTAVWTQAQPQLEATAVWTQTPPQCRGPGCRTRRSAHHSQGHVCRTARSARHSQGHVRRTARSAHYSEGPVCRTARSAHHSQGHVCRTFRSAPRICRTAITLVRGRRRRAV